MRRLANLSVLSVCLVASAAPLSCAKDDSDQARTTTPASASGSSAPSAADSATPPEPRTPEDPKLVWTPSSVVLLRKELAPSVYAILPDDAATKNAAGIPAATSGGFIVGERGVLVIESMINRRLATQMLALVREVTPKPILYVVNTSYHGDHSYGNQFFPASTQVVQHVEAQAYIQRHFTDDVAFMKQYFGANQGLDELKPRAADVLLNDNANVEIDLGGRRATLLHLGFAQTKGDLFVWLPTEKVLYTGNPIISDGASIPWLLDGQSEAALATLRKLNAMLPRDATVVPGHGAPTSVKAVEHHIAYLEELRKRVADAIAQGLTEQQTVERVSEAMKVYAAYKIYPWVHSQVNVPKTYQELKARK